MFNYTALAKADGKPEWNGESSEGISLCVRGTEEGPDPVAIQQAKAVVDALSEVRRKAIEMADSFMKDEGDWHLIELDVGPEAQRYECDYLVGLYFETRDGSDEYGYTRFSVCFRSHAGQPAASQNHPWKLIIEYR
ncbi:hypothetical protein M2165_003303 [Variovorax sp. TBS-050B]|uniref:hypothetical protein n=1 Tax=Variovorax sp. TBS-050B TaxID=2940551 RepID=UPI002475D417|nr:hypothetical protein [Variovorax sp. TBS-050B]MDH6593414.1 hypothetical protein [Variovorax sp. TBS-050B]